MTVNNINGVILVVTHLLRNLERMKTRGPR